jgi:hypothetical protein
MVCVSLWHIRNEAWEKRGVLTEVRRGPYAKKRDLIKHPATYQPALRTRLTA